MIKGVRLPLGVARIFGIGYSKGVVINNVSSHRPDRILTESNVRKEIMNNYLSQTSPISLETGDVYTVMNNTYYMNFGV